ncbi:ABC transporter substrate-binding protein [Amnibacterium sp. CER49]|uniref:ABC transporter substrate-binding protein n=1 Tax=Amnibacterium sp. CER49 TaxID=3039161 RepID=UPI002448895D|nr:ABC transporter substrate-binding protein [Amnibacterium sp. CER49]MDH2444499.1 ABC transporter substrate-binding protein [Amnibacterium sp. CER49]
MARVAVSRGRGPAVIAGAVAAALLLAGCSTGSKVDVKGSGGAGGASGTLKVAIAGEPDQLDPQKTSSYFSFEVLENVFDTLVEPDAKLTMQPALAKSWTTSTDQLTWTFSLRQGVTFQDGSKFSASDVVYSYNRIIDDKLSNAYKFANVKSVTAKDPSTVVISLKQPTPNLLSNLGGFKGMAIVEKSNVTDKKIATQPIGTGPFSVAKWTQGDSITLKANPKYWGGAPKVAGITYRFISSGATAIAALKSGEIDWTDSIPAQQVSTLKSASGITLGNVPSNDYWYLALNEKRKPWNDVRVRQAIAYAINRDDIVKVAKYGNAQVNELAIPKQSAWYTSYDKYSTNIAKAKQLLSQAGVSGTVKLDFLATSDYPETVSAAQVIADELQPLGIKVSIRTPDFATWLQQQNSGKFDMLMMGWLGNIDPDDFYYNQHHTGGGSNAQGYSNKTVDKLLDAARTETDQAKRKQDYAQAATQIADDASYIYLYNPTVIQAYDSKVKGYTVRGDRAIRFKDVSLG